MAADGNSFLSRTPAEILNDPEVQASQARECARLGIGPQSGVRWSGMNDERSWAVSAELQAELDAAYTKAKARMEAEVAEYAKRAGLIQPKAA